MKTKPERVENKKTKQSLRMTTAEILAEEMFFQNICDMVETEGGQAPQTPKGKIN